MEVMQVLVLFIVTSILQEVPRMKEVILLCECNDHGKMRIILLMNGDLTSVSVISLKFSFGTYPKVLKKKKKYMLQKIFKKFSIEIYNLCLGGVSKVI